MAPIFVDPTLCSADGAAFSTIIPWMISRRSWSSIAARSSSVASLMGDDTATPQYIRRGRILSGDVTGRRRSRTVALAGSGGTFPESAKDRMPRLAIGRSLLVVLVIALLGASRAAAQPADPRPQITAAVDGSA